jgi:hypothetical protein
MTYLDPPSTLLGGGSGMDLKRTVLSRTSRMSEMAFGDEEMKEDVKGKGKGKEVDRGGLVGEGNWSPWKEKYAVSRTLTPTKRNTPSRLAESRDVSCC